MAGSWRLVNCQPFAVALHEQDTVHASGAFQRVCQRTHVVDGAAVGAVQGHVLPALWAGAGIALLAFRGREGQLRQRE